MQASQAQPSRSALCSQRTGSSVHRKSTLPASLGGLSSQRCSVKAPATLNPDAEPARHMPLPGGALWLLSYMQDQFYDIRGPSFVIARNEASGTALRKMRSRDRAIVPAKESAADSSLGLIHQASRTYPWASTLLLEGSTVDISQFLEECSDQEEEQEGVTRITANTSCTGIVRVETDEPATSDEESADVFFTDSASPRRTKLIGFTCKCCGARNYSKINPRAFLQGTLVAQCAKCERWHKLSDHFKLFHDLQGSLYPPAMALSEDDVPPSLRIDPSLWKRMGEDGYTNDPINN